MPDARAEATATDDRPAVSPRTFGLLSAVVAVLVTSVAIVAYRELVHYERRAIDHVPPGSEFAARVDLEQLVTFEPVRQHLIPLVDRAPLAGAGLEPSVPRLVRLREEGGLNLGLELRELVFARAPGGGWVLALGGIFGTRRVLDGVAAVLGREPALRVRREARAVVLEPSGLALGQADDGVLLVASDAAMLARALPSSEGYAELGLDSSGAGALAALPRWFETFETARALRTPQTWRRSSARVDFGDPFELTLRIEQPVPSEPESARAWVAGWFGIESGGEQFVPQADWGGERSVLARARFSSAGGATVVSSTWQRSELDHAARSLATWLEARFQSDRPVTR